jgi:hypothetical protein
MAPFDPELHLRLLGERGLVRAADPQGRPRSAELAEAARALVAVGTIDLADAAEIVEGYQLAEALRHGRGLWRPRHQPPPTAPTPPEPRRTVVCNATLERPTEEIHVRSVTLSQSETRLSVVIRARSGPGLGARRRRRPLMPMKAMFSYPITDDRGARSTTDFTGGGSDREWRGRLTTHPPLAADTAWIELDGTRIELVDAAGPCTVSVEPATDGDVAARYLWHWLAAVERHGRELGFDAVLDALIGAGCLRAEDPQLAAMRHAYESRRPSFAQGRGSSAPAPIDGASPEWRSFLQPRPGRRTARGAIALTATTPPFDGITVTVDELTADEHGWQIEVDVTPGIIHGPFAASLEDRRVAWWAVDDLGQHYLGQFGAFSGGPDGSSGALEFGPGLDRAATALTLLPTGPTERARIEFPLHWSRR